MTRRLAIALGTYIFAMGMFGSSAFAAKFSNQFTEFELPAQWGCNLEGAEWVCQNTNDVKKKDAIIVLAAKIKTEQDNMESYLTYLKAAKSFMTAGKSVKSEPRYAKTVNLSGQAWVDALHMESEIPGFYTRYLATVKQDIGVLVTMSVSKAKYQAYLKDFDEMIKTIKVFRLTTPVAAAPAQGTAPQQVNLPTNLSETSVFPGANPVGATDKPKPQPQGGGMPIVLIALIVGVVGFFIWKKKREREE